MPIRDVFKISRKTFFNPSAWLDVDSLREYNRTIFDSVGGMFTGLPAGEARKETFAQAMKRQGVTEKQVKQMEVNYFAYSMVFLGLGIIMLLFGFYLLFQHTLQGWILALASAAFLFAQAFRFHFWYFQIKFRKLGCTFEEWKRGKPFEKEPMA